MMTADGPKSSLIPWSLNMLLPRWPLYFGMVLCLAAVPGCSSDEAEKPSDFDLVTSPSGFLTFRPRSSEAPPSEEDEAPPSDPQALAPAGSLQQLVQDDQLEAEKRQRQTDDEAFKALRKAQLERARLERQQQAEEDAYQK